MNELARRPVAEVRQIIARNLVYDGASIPETLGRVTLRRSQRDVAARLAALISVQGGAMLAEPVGLGKTYAGLAVAATFGTKLVIVAPAALREMWTRAISECGMTASIVSHEAMSRGIPRPREADLVIVDEAHRFRSHGTRRYATLAGMCRRAKVLLITATPIQNRRGDLAAQLALFLGRAAWQLDNGALGAYVIRESSISAPGQPRLSGPHAIVVARDDDCLDAIVALPPPIPARSETMANALLMFGILHQWSSSRAALIASLERRRARGVALLAAFEAGRHPTRRELAAWSFSGDALQLAFPELVASPAEGDHVSLDVMAGSLVQHDAAVADLLRRLRNDLRSDRSRADALRAIRRAHPGERIIAFSHYAETVIALRGLLAHDPGVAALTARGARVAGGRISRYDVLSQFTPGNASTAASLCEHISLLITTDLLSEGLNLQKASVIVHLDLPWNPARLEQRVGRARRLGSNHDVVTVYGFDPPASAERVLQIERRLQEKLAIAALAIGRSPPVLPSLVAAPSKRQGHTESASAIVIALRAWAKHAPSIATEPIGGAASPATERGSVPAVEESLAERTIVAAVESDVDGFLALVFDNSHPRLIAKLDGDVDLRLTTLRRAIALSDDRETQIDDSRLELAVTTIRAWAANRRGAITANVRPAIATPERRAGLRRIAKTLTAVPRHQRARLATIAAAAREAMTAPMSEGAERLLDELVRSDSNDEHWLRSVARLGKLYARQTIIADERERDGGILAIILFHSARISRSDT